MSSQPTELESKIKASLDASVLGLDQDTQRKLAVMRANALKKQQAHTWLNFKAWGSASAVALSALLAVLFVSPPQHVSDTHIGDALPPVAIQQNLSHTQPEQLTMLELLTNAEDMETATDPDFYVWIDEILATEGAKNAV